MKADPRLPTSAVLPAAQEHRVLVLGDAILDEYVSGDCSRLSPEAPVPVLRVRDIRQVLGGAANTAANVASLGGQAILVALVGDDAAGEALALRSRQAGIVFEAITHSKPTLRKTRVVGQHQQLVRLDYEETLRPDASLERRVLELFERHVAGSHIVVISDYAKGFLTRALCQSVIRIAHEHGKEVVIDPRPQHRDFYAGCDYLTPNWNESQAMLGRSDAVQTPESVRESGIALARSLSTNVLLTLGAEGMMFFGRTGQESFAVPTVAKEVFDVSGAGDTVVATFALARAAGAANYDAVALANKAAGIVVGKFGTATVTRDELSREDEASGRLVSRGELAVLCETLRAKGKRIVTINGAFDLLHTGHLHILREASRQGEVLIVGLNSDESVRAYKGAGRPIVPEAQRAEMLLALRYVDYVHIYSEPVPMPFLEEVRPAVHVNGAEYGENCVEAATVARYNGRLHLVKRLPGFSTTDLIGALTSRS